MKLNDLKIIAKKRSKEKNFMKNLLVNPLLAKKYMRELVWQYFCFEIYRTGILVNLKDLKLTKYH